MMKNTKYICLILTAILISVSAASVFPASPSMAIEAAEQDTFKINNPHSLAGFAVKFMAFSTVRGKFNDVTGTLIVDGKDLTNAEIEVTIKVSSVNTGNDTRDEDLMSDGFFDEANHPEIIYKSSKIEKTEDGFLAFGSLTIRGTTKEIEIPFEITNRIKNSHIGTLGRIRIYRFDYGLTATSQFIDPGKIFVSKDVDIELDMLWINGNSGIQDITPEIEQVIADRGIEAAVKYFYFLKAEQFDLYSFGEQDIQGLANNLLEENKVKEAIEFYKVNVTEFPESFYVYFNLAKAYEIDKNIPDAIKNLEKTLEINPFHASAEAKLKELKGGE